MSEKKMSRTHQLVVMAMLVAIQVILSRVLSINLWNLKIGFAFVPIAIAGILLGPVGAGLTGTVADLIGATLLPSGTFFPGFTLTAFITAFGYGFFLQKKQDMPHILAAVLFSEIVGTLLLNTKWLSILYGTPFMPIFITRVGQAVGMGIVEVIVIKILAKYVPQLKKAI